MLDQGPVFAVMLGLILCKFHNFNENFCMEFLVTLFYHNKKIWIFPMYQRLLSKSIETSLDVFSTIKRRAQDFNESTSITWIVNDISVFISLKIMTSLLVILLLALVVKILYLE